MNINKIQEIIRFENEDMAILGNYEKMFESEIFALANEYMNNSLTAADATDKINKLSSKNNSFYTLYLLFVLHCIPHYFNNIKNAPLGEEIFCGTVRDVKNKAEECRRVFGVLGLKNISWFNNFFKNGYVTLGRLQFAPINSAEEDIRCNDFTLYKDDFRLACHIPSGSPLDHEECMNSYKMAHSLFADKLKNNILPITCGTWLLYPPYLKEIFSASSNTAAFAKDFQLYATTAEEKFTDAWRVFGKDFGGNIKELPKETRLQKNFIEYFKKGGSFGRGYGLLLFDGENVIF